MALVCDQSNTQSAPLAVKPTENNLEEDLEDGEIEDDDEDEVVAVEATPNPLVVENIPQVPPSIPSVPPSFPQTSPRAERSREIRLEKPERRLSKHDDKKKHMTEAERSILHLREREKMQRKKWEKYTKKNPPASDPLDDDFAKNIEKTLATILSKKEKEAASLSDNKDDDKDEKRGRKRKKRTKNQNQKNKQRRTESPSLEMDENEMMNIRGGSPNRLDDRRTDSENSYTSDEYLSDKSPDEQEPVRNKKQNNKNKKNKNKNNKYNNRENNRRNNDRNNENELKDAPGVCGFFLQGKCSKSDCQYSHEAVQPRKLELCKFYLMECCAKGGKCLYMHSDFPCKFYHTGLQCDKGEECKFAHGKPLSDGLKQILFKHIETAPRDILGGFPRMSREESLNMINVTQKNLQEKYGVTPDDVVKSGIPSLFDINIPVPPELLGNIENEVKLEDKKEGKRARRSRWQDPEPEQKIKLPFANFGDQDMRINSNGDVDMRTLPLNLTSKPSAALPNLTQSNSIDIEKYKRDAGILHSTVVTPNMNVPPPIISNRTSQTGLSSINLPPQSVLSNVSLPQNLLGLNALGGATNFVGGANYAQSLVGGANNVLGGVTLSQSILGGPTFTQSVCLNTQDQNKDTDIRNTNIFAQDVDIRQNNLDPRALASSDVDIRQVSNVFDLNKKLSESEDENSLKMDINESEKQIPDLPETMPKAQRDLFMRIQATQKENLPENNESDYQNCDNINWYSDDESDDENRLTIKVEGEEPIKEREEPESEENSRTMSPPVIKPLDVVEKLGDLSKIDISAEVTKLLTSMSQARTQFTTPTVEKESCILPKTTHKILLPVPSLQATPPRETNRESPPLSDILLPKNDPRVARSDPRAAVSDPRMAGNDPRARSRQNSNEEKKKVEKPLSIYEQGSISREETKNDDSDVTGNDIDLRRSDIDLRNLGLGFKAMANYTPASEIDASINSHLPIVWKVLIVEIPRPDYTGLKLTLSDAEKSGDPRLKKIFRLCDEKDSPMSPKECTNAPRTIRSDPRLKKQDDSMSFNQQLNTLQSSQFYQSLTSNQKLMLNQEIASRNDQSNTHDPVLNSLLSNLNIIPNMPNLSQNNPNLGVALNILAKLNPLLAQSNPLLATQNPNMLSQNPGILGAGPNMMPHDFPINFDPRNGGLLGNAPPQFGGFNPDFNDFGAGGQGFNNEEFYNNQEMFEGGNNNRGHNNNNRGYNRDRRRGRNNNNFNNNRNNRNFRNNRKNQNN